MLRRGATSILGITLLILAALSLAPVQGEEKRVLWVDLGGFISPASSEHIASAVEEASKPGYVAVILALDTFGGSMDSTFDIIDSIQRSSVPVIGYVYPPGKQALSAGTFILVATDYAAMAPFTTIGSAQPMVAGEPTEEPKIINALTRKAAELARLHKRNEEQIVRFITENDNLGAEEALAKNVIEAVAATPEELLAEAHDAEVFMLREVPKARVLDVQGARVVKHEPSVRTTLLGAISEPIISNLLISVGLLAIILGLTSPGWGAEVLGTILLLLGLVGQGFNVNLTAMALMAIGAGLLIFELHTPGFGVVGMGGLITTALGMVLLVTQPVAPLLVTTSYIDAFLRTVMASLFVAGAFFGLMTYKAAKAARLKKFLQPYPSGEGKAVDDLSPSMPGYVVVGGEHWRARATEAIKAGSRVRVVRAEGRVLVVEPAS